MSVGGLLLAFVGNVVVSLLGLVNVGFEDVVDIVGLSGGFHFGVRILRVHRCRLGKTATEEELPKQRICMAAKQSIAKNRSVIK